MFPNDVPRLCSVEGAAGAAAGGSAAGGRAEGVAAGEGGGGAPGALPPQCGNAPPQQEHPAAVQAEQRQPRPELSANGSTLSRWLGLRAR